MDSQNFGAAAQRLYGLAARLLAWRPDEFWAATPAEFASAFASSDPFAQLNRAELTHMMEQDNAHECHRFDT